MLRFNNLGGLLVGLCLLLVILPVESIAQLPPDVVEDFEPVSAALVMPMGSEWIIDQDASTGVTIGDLFSVVTKGKPVIHPQTKEILGSVETVEGVLQVTRIKSGYSYAKVIDVDGELVPGQKLKRYYNLTSSFWDYTGEGEAVFIELRNALPHLEWQDYAEAQQDRPISPGTVPQATRLLFVLTEEGLTVKDNSFQTIHFYQPDELTGRQHSDSNQTPTSMPASATGIVVANKQADIVRQSDSRGIFDKLSDKLFGSEFARPDAGRTTQSGAGGSNFISREKLQGVWYGPHMKGQPVGIEVGDFDGDGQQEVAAAFLDRIVVGRVVDREFKQLTSNDITGAIKPLSLDGVDLNRDGKVELYLTAVNGLRASSECYEWQDGQLVKSIQSIPWFIRKVSLPGEGAVLLGQAINENAEKDRSDYRKPIFRISRTGDELSRAAELSLPSGVELNGFLPYPGTDKFMLLNLNANNKLQLLGQNGHLIWESHDDYGRSKNIFKRTGELPGDPRYRFLKQRLEVGPGSTVLVPVNEGSSLTDLWNTYNKSHLQALAYDGYSIIERWRTIPQNGYLADFRLADIDNDEADEIVMVVQFAQGDWLESSEGISAILYYELQ